MADKDGKNYLVTGGAGFIGSHLAKRLLNNGHNVWVVDNLSTGKKPNVPGGAVFLQLDISSADAYRAFPTERIDAVLHLAAQSSGEISDADPVADLKANAEGTLRLLDWTASSGTPRFIFAGSMGSYGQAPDGPVGEDQPCRPLSFYGASKLVSEHHIRLYQAKGLKTTIFRIFNAYGPGQNLDNLKQGMASIYLAYLIKGQPILVKGALDRWRDFIYIDDLVDAWLAVLDDPTSFGQTYNLASGTKTQVSEVLSQLKAAWGAPADYPVETADGTPGDTFGIYADISRITSELEWRPRVTLADGLGRMVSWVRELSGDATGVKAP